MPMTGHKAYRVALVGAGNFALNIEALLSHFGLAPAFCVDEFHDGGLNGLPVLRAAELDAARVEAVDKFVVAMSNPDHRAAAIERLTGRGVAHERILAIADDPGIQILRLLFERFGEAAVTAFAAAGCTTVPELEARFLGDEWQQVLDGLDPARPTIGLGYYGRGGGFRQHIAPLIPRLEGRFNLVSLSDELADGAGEIPGRHLYMSAETAAGRRLVDLVLSAHVFPCSPPGVPRVTLPHTIYDFNLSTDYHAERLAQSEPHYLFAASRPSLDAYVRLIRDKGLSNRLCVIPGGYPHLDENMRLAAAYRGPVDSIIYAPTLALADYPHYELASSMDQGLTIVQSLLARFPEHVIIFRPHPSDLKLYQLRRKDKRNDQFAALLELCAREPRCVLDAAPGSYMASYNRAAMMVSDTSSTAMTYAFATGRPAFFYAPRNTELVATLGEQMAFVADRARVGVVAIAIDELLDQMAAHLDSEQARCEDIRAFRDTTIFNPGRAADYLADNIDYMLSGERHADWLYFNW
jgi:hypothetical protein